MRPRSVAVTERLRSSLFIVPTAYVIVGLVLALVGIRVDRELVDNSVNLPFGLTTTVESARSVLTVVASATITVAGIAFSVALLIMQLAGSQYSPRIVPGLFRDPFNKRVMGVVVGTFTYCLAVLRAVRSSIESGGEPVIPNLSVAFAVLFGIVSVLAIVAFISHNAHSIDVSRILYDATHDAVQQVRSHWREPGQDDEDDPGPSTPPTDVLVVDFLGHGWLQGVDLQVLASAADPGGTVRLETSVGRYAVAGMPLCTIWPRPGDEDRARTHALRSITVGEARTSPEDVAYGIRQLADVALKGLSPAVNDPTTAQDAMFHLGSVLRELLCRRPPHAHQAMDGDRTVILAEGPTHEDLIGLGFDEVRIAAADQPTASIYLLELIHLLVVSLDEDDLELSRSALLRQARLIRDGVEASSTLLPADVRRVIVACDRRFGHLKPVG